MSVLYSGRLVGCPPRPAAEQGARQRHLKVEESYSSFPFLSRQEGARIRAIGALSLLYSVSVAEAAAAGANNSLTSVQQRPVCFLGD